MEYKMDLDGNNMDNLDDAINGNSDALIGAFVWADTHQGHEYWSAQFNGRTPLDILTLKEIKRQCVDATPQTGTLKELGVKAGDVVEFDGASRFTVSEKKHHLIGSDGLDAYYACWDTAEFFRIISRAPDAEDTPKTWGEMTDAEKGALLLADQRGEGIERWNASECVWVDVDPYWGEDGAYRVKPTPSHLPLTIGEKYELENGEVWECIFVRGGIAWMNSSAKGTAYTFNASTGENISQGGGDYNVKGAAQC